MVERVNDGAPGKRTSTVDLARSVISHSGVILPGTVERERETATDIVR